VTAKIRKNLLLIAYTFLTLAAMIMAERSALAAGEMWEVRYYKGKLAIFDPKAKATYYETATMYQINDPYHGTISQEACVDDIGAKTKPYVVKTHMLVDNGGNIVNVSDRSDFAPDSKLKGTGSVSNSPWNWNNNYRLSLSYAGSNKVKDQKHIEVAFKLSPDSMAVRRNVYGPNGKLKQKWHGTLLQVSKEAFQRDAQAKKCWNYMD